jgi:hypothetical protein
MREHRSRRRPDRSPVPSRVPSRLPAPTGGPAGPTGRLPLRLALRRAWNAVNLSTPCGLVLARASGCPARRGPDGLVLATGYTWPVPDGGAFTVGNVVFLRPHTAATPSLLAHESRHATQYAWCAGLPFLVLYVLAVGWSLLRTGDTASRNVFERHAGLAAGGYRERPARWPRRSA